MERTFEGVESSVGRRGGEEGTGQISAILVDIRLY
jgi:hypothetical protein